MRFAVAALAGALFLAGCPDEVTGDTEPPVALEGPELTWAAPAELIEGTPLAIDVTATDPEGVSRVVTYYRTQGSRTWLTAPDMTHEGDVWSVQLEGERVVPPGLELYFKGEDGFGTAAFLPEKGNQEPLALPVRRVGVTVPYFEDFEGVPNQDIGNIGWSEAARGFEGYEFELTVGRAVSGESAVVHRRAPEGITGDIDDWLISPTLDMTTMGLAQVSWMEFGDRSDATDHSFWISTGSPHPSDGEFVEVTALSAAPEGEWGRGQVVDLSAWATEPAVHLAWVYRGVEADIWWIDDVSIEPLAPDLRVASVSWSPEPLAPGATGTVSLTIENRIDVDATDVSLTVTADEGASFDGPIDVGTVPGLGSVDVDVTVNIDPGYWENAWIPIDVALTSGDESWIAQDRILVGQPTLASLTYTVLPADEADPEQLVRVVLGTGDPLDPELEIPFVSEVLTSGTYDAELDITDYAPWLPPAPGQRWWVRVENGPEGTIDDFAIEYGGEVIDDAQLGFFNNFQVSVFQLPAPPELVVRTVSSTPDPVQPGDDVSWTIQVSNFGAPTNGATSVSIMTADPDITITGGGPVALTGVEGLGSGGSAVASFSFSVGEERKSSRPVRFIATVTDDYESIELPIDVAVPWPVLTVTGITVDDFFDGNNDGLLDEGESVNLDVGLTNVGGLATFSAVSCELSITGGTATATLDAGSGFFGVISAASTEQEDDFAITVTTGAKGDTIDMELGCSDGTQDYVVPMQLSVGERPWIAITPIPDAVGDVRDSYTFDFVDGVYRSDGTTLEIVLRSESAHGGLSGLFLEAWGNSAGAEYSFYNFVAAGSTGSMRGYDGSFTPLGSMTVTEIDAHRVKWEIPVAKLELRLDAVTLGFAAGFCGGTTQFCDHYPDGWGAPYTGWSTSRWVTLKW